MVFQLSVVESRSEQTVREVVDYKDSRLAHIKWKSMFSSSSCLVILLMTDDNLKKCHVRFRITYLQQHNNRND